MSVTARLRAEHGISVVEVLVAVMVLAVVAGGVGMAVTGAARQTVSSNSSKSQMAAATQMFESVKSHRDWMAGCAASFRANPSPPATVSPSCNLTTMAGGMNATTAAGILKANWLGNSCTGSAFSFRLVRLVATPRDSADDGQGTADADGVVPDYYRIQVSVDTADACDRTRLQLPRPSVVDSALDQHGKIPTASLTIDVCSATNQMDERMNVGSCTGGTAPRMQPCGSLPSGYGSNPGMGCPSAWAFGAGGDSSYPNPATDNASTYVNMAPRDLSFVLVGPNGSLTQAQASRHPRTGEYVFNDLPVGNYTIRSLGLAANEWLWWSKAIPSANMASRGVDGPNEVSLTLQPDTFNRALIPIRPNRPGAIDLIFKRQVTKLTYSGPIDTGWLSAGTKIPTESFYGDASLFSSYIAYINSVIGYDASIQVLNQSVNGNCLNATVAATISTLGTAVSSYTICTWYKLRLRYKYYRSNGVQSRPIFNGAVEDGAYSMTPAPTFRDQVTGGSSSGCVTGPSLSSMSQLINSACVSAPPKNGSVGPVQRVRLGGISAGLNTGIKQWSMGTSYLSAGDPYEQSWSAADNDAVQTLPGDLVNGIWVARNGAISTSSRSYGANPAITLIGKGECYWNGPGTVNHLGSCDPCRPYIAPLGGWFGSCYVLLSGMYEKEVYFTGDEFSVFSKPPIVRADAVTGIQECFGPPTAGNSKRGAPNCHKVTKFTGGTGPSTGVPINRHNIGGGGVVSPATPQGSG